LGRYILQRLGYMIVTLFVIVAITFFTMKLLPGTPYKNQQKLSQEQIALLNHKYGLDQPLPVQFVKYVGDLLHGDLGISFQFDGRSVNEIIGHQLPVSADLGFEALIFGLVFGLLLGIIAGVKRNTSWDYATMIIAVLGISIPSFVLAQIFQYYFAVQHHWLPVAYWEGPSYHVMPVIALGVGPLAIIARFMRTALVDNLGSDYIEMARAKGLSRTTVVFKHAVRNSLIPIVTIVGPMAVGLMTGVLVIENIFAIPGIGDQFVTSIYTNDYPMIMGTTIMFSVAFVVVILLVDILYGVIDPRIRLAGGDA
jgi:oligopeptide transport system permease protein